ncbi:MAG: glucose dehydrogenase, partial [Candidatus Lambdaproteobacteria bacterium]|nr:glucose dehydrogenase [Candidatus Lambdaproteobacteria bacterium]
YVFADFGSGTFWSIPADTNVFVSPQPLLRSDVLVSSFGEDEAGELYVTDLRGAIYRLVPRP